MLRNYVKSLLDLLPGLEPGTANNSWRGTAVDSSGEEQLGTAAGRDSALEVRKVYLVDPTIAHPLFQGNKVRNKLD